MTSGVSGKAQRRKSRRAPDQRDAGASAGTRRAKRAARKPSNGNPRTEVVRDAFYPSDDTRLVIASVAKQSSPVRVNSGLLRRLAPRNDAPAAFGDCPPPQAGEGWSITLRHGRKGEGSAAIRR